MKLLILSISISLLLFACGGKENTNTSSQNAVADGATIFKKYCILCHGADGKLGLNGAKDLTISPLTKAERMVLIANGKNAMTPFKGILSEAEIEAVADYTISLKK
jgi:mono/diheme cytochrome c family protein